MRVRIPFSVTCQALGLLLSVAAVTPLPAQDAVAKARQLEGSGDSQAAEDALREAAAANAPSPATLTAYAEFLDRYGSPNARAAYGKLVARVSDAAAKRPALRRLIVLDLQAGDRAAAATHLAEYRAAGGTDLGTALPEDRIAAAMPTFDLPGPISSFSRMAALAPDLKAEDILPALSRNVVTNGYQASHSQEGLEQTEYLKLVIKYLTQARELEKLAGESKVLNIETCESTQTGELLRVLGYRMRGACGGELVLETVNAGRAFLTIDSGFPLAELEQALRTNRAFRYDYKPSKVPVLYGTEYWMSSRDKQGGEFLDALLSDPSLCRLYLGLSKLDRETAETLRKAMPAPRLRAFAHVLDFFGGMFLIRDGKVAVPGGRRSAAAWGDLAGVSPDQGAKFIENLLVKEDGWLSSYFDALSRIDGPSLEYLTEPERLKRFYTAMRGRVTSPGPARPIFRSNTDLMLLTTRLRVEANGQPHLPGGLEVWKNLFTNHPQGKYDSKLSKAASSWKGADDVIEALFGLCRKMTENEPLKIFMAISDINRNRNTPLEAPTVDRLMRDYGKLSAQYPIFTEVSNLSDKAIVQFLDTAPAISGIRDSSRRADAAGTMQALLGLWQIFCRNEAIAPADAEEAFTGILAGFSKIKDDADVFTAGVTGTKLLIKVTHLKADAAQEQLLALLAGTTSPDDADTQKQLVTEMTKIFDAQKLISIKTLLDVADHLDARVKGEALNAALLNRVSQRLSELQLPRASLTTVEKNSLSFGYYTEQHIDAERKLALRPLVEKAGTDAAKLNDVRGQLAPVLRDTLVGLNYLYYAPPGAQVLRTNPVFIRSHDFLGAQSSPQTWRTTEVLGTGWPSSAGGRLVGSLAGMAYALAEAEQNFLVPSREQALIWGDLVPQMILSATIPRWWKMTPQQLHFVGLHVRLGESLAAEAVLDAKLRDQVVEVLGRLAAPARASRVAEYLAAGNLKGAMENMTASELFLIAQERVVKSGEANGPLEREITQLARASNGTVNYKMVSRFCGTPKPTLTTSYRPELLHLRTFPTLMGYSSRIMAESWESSILYYAALADELHLNPGRLNVAIPQWTQQTVERIFATHLEDWPALLRSLRVVGDDVRAKARQTEVAAGNAAGN